MISVDNLSKNYGKQSLFDSISFKVNRRERVGLVGRNGHGKTTLFRLIVGLETPDQGTISIPRNYRIGYVEQELEFSAESVLEEACKGLTPGASGETWRAEKVLSGLGFSKEDFSRHPDELSGGYQVRLNLVKVLLADFNLLLLDEPNNYLDITSIRWLSRFLQAWPGELILVTHDRSFMDTVVTHVLGIHRRKVRKISGSTEKYYTQIAQDEEVYEKTRINDERKRKEIELFISQFRAKARLVGLVQSRIKTLAKWEKREKLEKIKTLDFSFVEKPFYGRYAMSASDVSFSYHPQKPLIKDFSLTIGAKDRVCVIGKNGKGKTTLLKLLAGVLRPQRGEVSVPMGVSMGYYEQTNVGSLVDSRTVLEEIGAANPEIEPQSVWGIAGSMMFEGDDALKKVKVLSGGEKSRVLISKILATPTNLLVLDEPTNHLDMESSDALLLALDNFDGAVVIVTHNEMFLHALAERLVVFQDDGISVYEGDYQRFLEKVGWQEERGKMSQTVPEKVVEPTEKPKLSRKEIRRKRSEILVERSAVLKPLEQRMSELEKMIASQEKELGEMNEAIAEASRTRESARIVELSKSIPQKRRSIDLLFSELEVVIKSHEEQNARFEQILSDLGDVT